MAITVDPEFGYVLLSGMVLCFVYMMHGPFVVARARAKVFNPEFMNEHFGELH